MSTTTDKATAYAYSGVTKKRGTVLEITAGRIDVGGSISFLSQYPGEKEFLLSPLACLEVRPPSTPLVTETTPSFRPSRHLDHRQSPPRPPATFPQWEGLSQRPLERPKPFGSSRTRFQKPE